MKRILLLNLPGTKTYLRDYYCSKVSKFDYIYHPVDLLMLSGTLKKAGFEVFLIDAIVNRINPERCLFEIEQLKPDAIIFLAGFVSWPEDKVFLQRLKKQTGIPLCGSGDIFLGRSRDFYEKYPFIDAFITDFTTTDIVRFLAGHTEEIEKLVFRHNGRLFIRSESKQVSNYTIPVPLHNLFINKKYRFPFVRYAQFATVLTDYGCPFKCKFCIMSKLGYKKRPVSEVMEELKYLKKLGIKEIYFDDQTFGITKDRIQQLCSQMVANNLNFGWVCFFRVDLVSEQILSTMKRAGCHTIMFGIESGTQDILDDSGKNTRKEQVLKAIELCKKYNIYVVGTFIIGFINDSEKTIRKTIEFALESEIDYVSFNTLVPRPFTEPWEDAKQQGLKEEDIEGMDQSGTVVVLRTKYLSKKQVKKLRDEAYAKFYARPSYVLKKLLSIRTWYELETHIRGGLTLLANAFGLSEINRNKK